MTTTTFIELGGFLQAGSRVLAGRKLRASVRRAICLDRIDGDPAAGTEVHVPEDLLAMNMFFFVVAFGASKTRLGQDGFYRRYRFSESSSGL